MSVSITTACITCGACEWECPAQAISPGAPRPVVDTAACTECFGFFGESQCIVVCPADAIIVEDPEELPALAAKFHANHPGQPPQDTWIWRRITGAPRR